MRLYSSKFHGTCETSETLSKGLCACAFHGNNIFTSLLISEAGRNPEKKNNHGNKDNKLELKKSP